MQLSAQKAGSGLTCSGKLTSTELWMKKVYCLCDCLIIVFDGLTVDINLLDFVRMGIHCRRFCI